MGWLKIDDKYPRNPKVLAGDIETSWFYVCALTHCAEQLTDGFIADSAVPVIAPHVIAPQDVAERCVQLGMFTRVTNGFLVPDFLDFNPSRAEVVEKREKDRERQRKSRGMSQRDSRETSDVTPSVPSRPVPSTSISSSTDVLQRGDVDEELVNQVADAVVKHRASKANPTSPNWAKSVRRNLHTDDGGEWWANLERVCAEFPTAPVSMLVDAAEGRPHPMLAGYRREAS